MATGIEKKIDHLNPASWKGDVQVSGVQLVSAWKSGQHLVESDLELAAFSPAGKLNELEWTTGTDLLNPFGMELYQDDEDEETYDQIPPQAQLDPSSPAVPNSLDLEELIDNENAWENRLESTIDVGDGKCVHKAKV